MISPSDPPLSFERGERNHLMPRFFFTCAYDGAPWKGWQSQAGGGTVQDCIEEALARIVKAPVRICGAGRTDAGVHALGQCFHLDVPETCRLEARTWVAALNAHLPASIRVMSAEHVPSDFHARFNAVGKLYEYRLYTGEVLPPHLAGRVWHHRYSPDASLLQQALDCYCGEHDFRSFAARRGNEPDPPPPGFYHRTIYSASCVREGDLLRLRFHGNGFMYRMVRLLVGAACRVATGRMALAELSAALDSAAIMGARHCAPADGLFLVQVFYDANSELKNSLPLF